MTMMQDSGIQAAIRPAEVRLITSSQPEAIISSATSTANGAPTAHPTMPMGPEEASNSSSSV
jgi:hypothetical protein